jgi:hypothetical protein
MIGKDFSRFRGIIVLGILARVDLLIHKFAMRNGSRRDWW